MRSIKKGSTDQSIVIRIIDSSDGTPEIGVEHDSSGIDLWWRREKETKTSITEAALAALDSAHSDGGIEHIGDGYYRLDLPDAAVAAGAGENGVMIGGTVTDMIVIGCYIPLVDYDPYDTVRLGLTALPNAAADAAGGLPISDAGALDLDTQLGTDIDAILTDTAVIGALGAGLTAIPWNSDWDAEVQSECADALTAYDPPTKAEMDTGHGLLATEAKQDIIDGIVDDILVDTGTTLQAELDGIQADTEDLQTQIGTAGAGLTDLGGMSAGMKTEVNAEAVDTLNTDTYGEPGQEAPAAAATLVQKIGYLYKMWRNQNTRTSTQLNLYNDAADTIDQKATISDDATTFTKGEIGTGP